MRARDRARFVSRFDQSDAQDPMASLTNLVDVMLVVACGLAAALVAAKSAPMDASTTPMAEARQGEVVRELVRGREIPTPPTRAGSGGPGYEPVGRVFRDARTGALVLVDEPSGDDTGNEVQRGRR